MTQTEYKIKDFAEPISVSVTNPQSSKLDKFIGLEHYDSEVPVITRYSGTDILVSSCKEFRKNDILIARRNVYLKRAGIVFFDGLTSGDSIILRVFDDCERKIGIAYDLAIRILPFVLNSDSFWLYANRHADGMNSKRISKEKILDYTFNLPSLDEQKRLADKLWSAYEVKQSYIKMIDATNEMVKAKFVEMFGNPLINNKCWETKSMSFVAPESSSMDIQTGKVWLLNLDMIESNTGRIINKVYVDFNELQSVSPFDEGNLLFSKLRPYLNKVVIPNAKGWATTELIPLRPNEDIVNIYFLSHLLRGDAFVTWANSIATGTKMPRMPLSELRQFQVILPPMELQKEFVSIAEQADASIASLKKSIESIDKVIKSLINENL